MGPTTVETTHQGFYTSMMVMAIVVVIETCQRQDLVFCFICFCIQMSPPREAWTISVLRPEPSPWAAAAVILLLP